jgi:hypothetical protein
MAEKAKTPHHTIAINPSQLPESLHITRGDKCLQDCSVIQGVKKPNDN